MTGEDDRICSVAGAAALQHGCTNMETVNELRELLRVTKELAAGQGGSANLGNSKIFGLTPWLRESILRTKDTEAAPSEEES